MNQRTSHLNDLILNKEATIESYARMIDDVDDPVLKDRLKSIQENHFKQMMVFSDRVYEIGGRPNFKIGLAGVIDDMRHHRNRKNDTTDLENARIALNGERINIEKLSSYELNELDGTSLELLQMAANTNQENIKALEEYIQSFEIQ